jgi:acyl-CoA synthetase (AMP-forming)/AMP-acid ligase II
LTADQLDAACERIGATLAFASPAALGNVIATAGVSLPAIADLRLVLSAGAPVPAELLGAVAALTPKAELHTPYGMTEVLPVADIGLDDILAADRSDPAGGVCVGHVVPGAQVRIVELHFDALAVDAVEGPASLDAGQTGEILVRAPWVSDGYDGLWATERAARPGDGRWHRSGDVGHLDDLGRLWVEGRLLHLIDADGGPLTPVPIERVVERTIGARRVAAVGVGPAGVAQLVIVVEDPAAGDGLAAEATVADVRAAVGHPVAAVLTVASLPVDIRHNAKIDRVAVARWAAAMLSGDAVPSSRRAWRRA